MLIVKTRNLEKNSIKIINKKKDIKEKVIVFFIELKFILNFQIKLKLIKLKLMNLGEYFKISIISFFVFVLIAYFWEFKLYLKDLNYLNKINYEIDYRKPIEILKDSKNINKNTVIVSNHFKEYIEKPDLSIFLYRVFQKDQPFIVMKMAIIPNT